MTLDRPDHPNRAGLAPQKARPSPIRTLLRLLLALLIHPWTGWIAAGLIFVVAMFCVGPEDDPATIWLLSFLLLVVCVSFSVQGHVRRDPVATFYDQTEGGVRLRVSVVIGGAGRSEHKRAVVELTGKLPALEDVPAALGDALTRARRVGWTTRAEAWRFDKRIWPWTDVESFVLTEIERGLLLMELLRESAPKA